MYSLYWRSRFHLCPVAEVSWDALGNWVGTSSDYCKQPISTVRRYGLGCHPLWSPDSSGSIFWHSETTALRWRHSTTGYVTVAFTKIWTFQHDNASRTRYVLLWIANLPYTSLACLIACSLSHRAHLGRCEKAIVTVPECWRFSPTVWDNLARNSSGHHPVNLSFNVMLDDSFLPGQRWTITLFTSFLCNAQIRK